MADTLYTAQTPDVQNALDADSHAWGIKFTVSADCSLTGGRAWVPTGGRPTTFKWQVWRLADATKIAETDLNGGGHGSPSAQAWMSFASSLFSTPGDVTLSSAETYVVCVAFQDGNGAYTDNGSESFPLSSGGLASGSTGRFTNNGGTNVMPGTDYVAYFWADVDVVAAGGTEHTKSVGGSITPTSTIAKAVSRGLSGSATPAGALSKSVGRTLAGSTTPTGSLSKGLSRILGGSTTPSGAITRAIGRTLGGAIALTGTITRAISRTLSGSISPAGALLKGLSRLLGGSITPAGSVSSAPAEPGVPTVWRAGPPESKWSAGHPESKWSAGVPEGG